MDEVKKYLLDLLETAPYLVGMCDRNGWLRYLNPAGRRMLDLDEEEPVHQIHVRHLLSPAEFERLETEILPVLLEEGVWHGEIVLLAPHTQRETPVAETAMAHREEGGKLVYLSAIARDLSEQQWMFAQVNEQIRNVQEHSVALEAQGRDLLLLNARLEQANAQLEALSVTDGLTGLKNHRAFQERLKSEFQRSRRYRTPLSLLLLDVDHFKAYNDAFGHPAGDRVLQQVGAILEKTARKSDFVARYGGEEFAILLCETEESEALGAAERQREAILKADWEERPITISVGLSSLRPETQSPSQLVEEADRALYRAKAEGRNRVWHHASLDAVEIDKQQQDGSKP